MRHRKGKISFSHHMPDNIRPLLETIETWPEIDSIIPGRWNVTHGSSEQIKLKVQYRTDTGLKCMARSGRFAREIFLVTKEPDLIELRISEGGF